MPKYRVTKSFSHSQPVGSFVMSDDLHPFLVQHVEMVDERPVAEIMAGGEAVVTTEKSPVKRPNRQPPVKAQNADVTAEQMDLMHAEALALDKVLYPTED